MSETSTQPTTSTAIQKAEERLRTLLPGIYRDRTDEVQLVSMGSAPLVFDVDGNIAWDRIWGSFCDLAMAGGPPHKGKLLQPGTPESIRAEPTRYAEVCDEIVRGIKLAARLQAVPSSSPGWLRVLCSLESHHRSPRHTPRMRSCGASRLKCIASASRILRWPIVLSIRISNAFLSQ